MEKSCYRFEKVPGETPLFENVDATYVVHLEKNGRLDQVRKGLRDYFPSKNTCILMNKGYKTCKKELPEQAARFDIVDANLTIFRDAREKNYRNILVLEDDFFFNVDIRSHTHHIDRFILQKQDQVFSYFLGCIPGIVVPHTWNCIHYHALLGVASHAVIYSKNYRDELMQTTQADITDWDMFKLRFRPLHRYMYFQPLCHQLFPETENSKMWGSENIFLYWFARFVIRLFKLLNLHQSAEPGYSFFYFFSKIIIVVTVLFFCILFSKQTRKENKNKKLIPLPTSFRFR